MFYFFQADFTTIQYKPEEKVSHTFLIFFLYRKHFFITRVYNIAIDYKGILFANTVPERVSAF
jgi:hypothetical protein